MKTAIPKLFFAFFFCLLGCNQYTSHDRNNEVNEPLNFKEYYFPLRNKATIYKYKDSISGDVMLWEMRTIIQGDSTILETIILDTDSDTLEIFQEAVTDKGTVLNQFVKRTEQGLIKAKIKESEVYHWHSKKNAKWSIAYKDGVDSIFYSKSRSFAEDGMKIKKDKKYIDVLRFNEFTSVNINPSSNESYEFKFRSDTYFAKGIGIIEMKEFEDGYLMSHYRLESITPIIR